MVSLIESLLIGAGLAVALQMFAFQPFAVSGQSMEPNFYDGDRLVVDKISPTLFDYRRGEVVVFQKRDPIRGEEYLIKRIVALPSERIVIKSKRITVYNAENPRGFFVDESEYHPYAPRNTTVDMKLSKDEYFVLGDNRPVSNDSENFGPVRRSAIIGRISFRFFPFERASLFQPVP